MKGKTMFMVRYLTLAFLLIVFHSTLLAAVIKGLVRDAESNTPLSDVNVKIAETSLGAATDNEGHFTISNIPVGNYTLIFSCMGYETMLP